MNHPRSSLPILILGLAACGGAPKAPATTPAATPGGAATPEASAKAPAEAGADLDFWATIPRPAKSLKRVRPMLASAPAATTILEMMLEKTKAFDLEQPITFAGKGAVTIASFGVTREVADVLRKEVDERCVLFEQAGAWRFACSDKKGLDATGKALARFTPGRPVTSDMHLEAKPAALAAFADHDKKHGSDEERDDAAAAKEVIQGAALLGLQRVVLDVALEGTPEVRVAARVQGGPFGATLLDVPVKKAPPGFASLPVDAEMAFFAHAPAASEMTKVKAALLDKLDEDDRRDCPEYATQQRAQLEKLFFTGGSLVFGAGFDRARIEAASEALVKAPTDKKRLAAMRVAAQGWGIAGFEEPAQRWIDGLSALEDLTCPARAKDKPKKTVTVTKKLPARLGLPAGAFQIVTSRPATKDAPASRKIIFVVPDTKAGAERTWIGFGSDEAALAAKLKGVVGGAPGLGTRPGLAAVNAPATFSAFLTPAAAAWIAAGDEDKEASLAPLAEKTVAAKARETGARTPIFVKLAAVRDAKGDGGEIALRLTLESGAIADMATLF